MIRGRRWCVRKRKLKSNVRIEFTVDGNSFKRVSHYRLSVGASCNSSRKFRRVNWSEQRTSVLFRWRFTLTPSQCHHGPRNVLQREGLLSKNSPHSGRRCCWFLAAHSVLLDPLYSRVTAVISVVPFSVNQRCTNLHAPLLWVPNSIFKGMRTQIVEVLCLDTNLFLKVSMVSCFQRSVI